MVCLTLFCVSWESTEMCFGYLDRCRKGLRWVQVPWSGLTLSPVRGDTIPEAPLGLTGWQVSWIAHHARMVAVRISVNGRETGDAFSR